MSFRILKYELKPTGFQQIVIAAEIVRPISVGVQGDKVVMWAKVAGENGIADTLLNASILATGHPVEDSIFKDGFVGTFQLDDFVGHVFCEMFPMPKAVVANG